MTQSYVLVFNVIKNLTNIMEKKCKPLRLIYAFKKLLTNYFRKNFHINDIFL